MQSNDLLEYLMLQQLGGGGAAASAQVWLQVTLLVCLFLAAILRPEVVRAKALFRMACVLFALSLLVSPTLNFLLGYLLRLGNPGPAYGRMQGEMTVLLSFPAVVSSVLFGLSLICGLCSLGLGGAAAAKTPQSITPQSITSQSMSKLATHATPPSGGWDDMSGPRSAPPGKVHPLDEPD